MASLKEQLFFKSPLPLQNWLVSRLGLSMARKRYGDPFAKILYDIQQENKLSEDEITAKTLDKLRKILTYSEQNIPYYSRLFEEHSIVVDKIKCLEEIQKIPPLEKEVLRQYSEKLVPTDINQRSFFIQNTSGSTGKPLSIHVDELTYKTAMALLVHHEQSHGVSFGDRRATFAGRMIQRPEDNRRPFCRYNSAENQLLFSSYHISAQNFEAYEKELNRFKPLEIIGYPSAISAIAHLLIESGRTLLFKPKLVVTNSETLLAHQREVIERAFGCSVFDYYGTAEYVTFASECCMSSYHVYQNLGIMEVVDENNKQLYDGEGDILCTSISNYAMPLIRYRVGDRARVKPSACACGSPHPVIQSFEGRIDDFIVSISGNRIGRLDHIYKGMEGIREAQLVQHSHNHCVINIVPSSQFDIALEKVLVANLKDRVGQSMQVEVQYVSEVEKGKNGKFKAVVSNLSV